MEEGKLDGTSTDINWGRDGGKDGKRGGRRILRE